MSDLFIGTSGWHYDHWKGPFYPQDIESGDMLSFYMQHFQTVEINNSFYQLPDKETFENWSETTFEFRDPSWFDPRVYELLGEHGVAFCMYHLNQRDSPRQVTADFIYVRLHGPDGSYKGSYDMQSLSGWAGAFSTWAQQGKDIYCYFNNDQGGYAVKNARQLKEMLE